VRDVAVGDEVFTLTPFERDGCAAEFALVPTAVLAPKPHGFGYVESAALTLAGLSAWHGLYDHGRLREGERVRVTGASGGVGHLAVQLATLLKGDVVDAVASLKEQPGDDILIYGSHVLVNDLLPHKLIDEYRFEGPPS
jgi:NADPH:quinone reductase-like Zn-dependent oxidoreductase